MIKKLSTIFLFLVFASSLTFGQRWVNQGFFPDTTFKGGSGLHGVAVDADGKIWASFYQGGGTLGGVTVTPVFVFNPDGSMAFDTIKTITVSGVTDTLKINTRGIVKDHEGNILLAHGSGVIYRLDYKTGEGLGKLTTNTITSLCAPAVDEEGNIYVSYVLGGNPAEEYTSDFNFIANAFDTIPDIGRTMAVAQDGLTMWVPRFTASTVEKYERPDKFSTFTEVDNSALDGMVVESMNWNPRSNRLWMSTGSLNNPPSEKWAPNTWIEFDGTNDGERITWEIFDPILPANERPRAIDFTADGNTAYVGAFGSSSVPAIQKFVRETTDSADITVRYEANMEIEILSGRFDTASDSVWVRGAFNGWGTTDLMSPSALDPNVYFIEKVHKMNLYERTPNYKFFYNPGNWEGGSDKNSVLLESEYDDLYKVINRGFNDGTLETVTNQTVTITFKLDANQAVSSVSGQPFPAINTVHITGPFITENGWPDGGWPTAQIDRFVQLFDDGATAGDAVAGDKIFTGTVTFAAYSPLLIEYKYSINFGDDANNGGGNDNESGIGTNHFIELTPTLSSATVENVFSQMGTHPLVDMVTGVEELPGTLPTNYTLDQNYPNPFNPSTSIRFSIPEAGVVSLKVYDMLGREVSTLVNEYMGAGTFQATFDASELTSGVYFYTLTSNNFSVTKKMMLIK